MDHPATTKTEILSAIEAAIGEDGAEATLAPLLFARPPAEDLAEFTPEALALAARAGFEALCDHRRGAQLELWRSADPVRTARRRSAGARPAPR